MSRWGYDYYFPAYVSVANKRKKAAAKLTKLTAQFKKKGKAIFPVVIEGKKLSTKWWGIAWNKNLESYADYGNRLGRGRSYVRHGQVLHLEINRGKVVALVSGSGPRPYNVIINITKLSPAIWKNMIQQTEGQIDSLQNLLAGEFPKPFQTLFADKQSGLFPSPKQIKLECDCPDWANMCKHVAATLYGIGARLDTNPELFFTLRGVNLQDLVSKVIAKTTGRWKKPMAKSKRSLKIKEQDLGSLFGISMGEGEITSGKKRTSTKKSNKKIQRKSSKTKVPKKKTKKLSKKKIVKKRVTQSREATKTVKKIVKKKTAKKNPALPKTGRKLKKAVSKRPAKKSL